MEKYKSIQLGMKSLMEKAEELGWWWTAWIEENQSNRTYVEIGKNSPAGEDFSMIIDFDAEKQCASFLDNLDSYYQNFDIDEHIEMWVKAKRNGVSGAPSIRELVDDAKEIDAMILKLSQTLREMEVEDDNEQ